MYGQNLILKVHLCGPLKPLAYSITIAYPTRLEMSLGKAIHLSLSLSLSLSHLQSPPQVAMRPGMTFGMAAVPRREGSCASAASLPSVSSLGSASAFPHEDIDPVQLARGVADQQPSQPTTLDTSLRRHRDRSEGSLGSLGNLIADIPDHDITAPDHIELARGATDRRPSQPTTLDISRERHRDDSEVSLGSLQNLIADIPDDHATMLRRFRRSSGASDGSRLSARSLEQTIRDIPGPSSTGDNGSEADVDNASTVNDDIQRNGSFVVDD